MNIKFEWDIDKALHNFQKHDITFEEAKTIWDDRYAAFLEDPNHSKGEHRFIMIGYSKKNN